MSRQTNAAIMANVSGASHAKRVANNTVRYEREDGSTVWRLHTTDIVVRHANGTFELNSGGWRTPTTKERIGTFAPVQISSRSGVWYVGGNTPFYDGMRVDSAGKPIGKPRLAIVKDTAALKKRIAKFVKLVDAVAELPQPNGGDCWNCLMFDNVPAATESDSRMGYATNKQAAPSKAISPDHLLSHMDEGYLPGALLVNAMRFCGYRDAGIAAYYGMDDRWGRAVFKRALRRYLNARLAIS